MRESFQNSEAPKAEVSNDELRIKKLETIEHKMRQQLDNARREARESTERPLKYMEERLKLSLNEEELLSFKGFFRESELLKTHFTSEV